MPAVQSLRNNDISSFIKGGNALTEDNAVLAQDAGRGAVALENFTIMGQQDADEKWVPVTDLAAVDGTANPRGILISGQVTGAELVAGDVVDQQILVGAAVRVDKNKVILENSLTLASIIENAAINGRTILAQLRENGIFLQDSVDVDLQENA